MWIYQDNEVLGVPVGAVGFVYLITRKRDGKKYIGQKTFWSRTTPRPLKDGKKRRKVTKESDWRNYWGSSNDLKADILAEGKDGFRREILSFCYSKTEMNWLEMKEQVLREVLHSDEYYNSFIGGKITRVHVNSYTRK